MTKIIIKITTEGKSLIRISNSAKCIVDVDGNEATVKASDIFKLFDNGIDVFYECADKTLEPLEGQTLNRLEQMFNDCLELINDIISSVNQKISSYQINEKEQVESEDEI